MKTNRIIKGLSFILSLLIICSAMSSIIVYAESNPRVVVSKAENVEIGETVDITVSLENNPGIVAATLKISFDSDALTLKNVKDEGVLGAQSHKPELASPYTLAWANDTATKNYTVNGAIATLTFSVNDSAEKGKSYPIELTYDYDNYDVYDKDLNLVKFSVENGKVSLKAAENNTETHTEGTTAQTTTEATETPTTAPATNPYTVEPTQPETTFPVTEAPTTEPVSEPATEPVTEEPESLQDGYYLVGSIRGDNSWNSKIHKELVFHENALSIAFGEYILPNVELKAADAIKVVSVKDQDVSRWYPEGVYNDYIIVEDGTYNIYFRPDGVGADDWWDGIYGNFFFVEKVNPTEPSEEPTQPATDPDVKAMIKAESVYAPAGTTVDVPIVMSDNPGIVGMTLMVRYNSSALRLTGVKDGGILGAQSHKPEFTSPYTLAWANDTAVDNYTVNGTLATLTFEVLDGAEGKYPVEISYNYDNYDIYDKDLNLIKFNIINGSVSVGVNPTETSSQIKYALGDVNMDGGIDVRDATTIQRYIAKIITLTDEQFILADVNKDGGIDVRDATMIKRAIAKIIPFDF